MYAREFLEYGEAKDGYWTSDKFIKQIKKALKLLTSSTPRVKVGELYGYLTIAVAMLRWLSGVGTGGAKGARAPPTFLMGGGGPGPPKIC